MVKCPFCGFTNEDGALFCEQCKSDISGVAPATPKALVGAPLCANMTGWICQAVGVCSVVLTSVAAPVTHEKLGSFGVT